MKRVDIARFSGFCMGVRRALSLCMNLVSKKCAPLFTLGPIIHNNTVIEGLAKLGVKHIKLDDSIPRDSYVLIRSHGVSPDTLNKLTDKSSNICDATCPKVAKVQGIVKGYVKRGFKIIIIGDHGHAETQGLMGYTGGNGYIVANRQEAENLISCLDKTAMLCVVAQTTQELQLFDNLCKLFSSGGFAEVKVVNTICDATMKRQGEVSVLAPKYDVVIVAGGSHSANTRRLYEIARADGKRAYFVEKVSDIPFDQIRENDSVLITAGASTPLWLIQDIKTALLKERLLYRFISVFSSRAMYWLLSVSLLLVSVFIKNPFMLILTILVMLIAKGTLFTYMKYLDFLVVGSERWLALAVASLLMLISGSIFFELKIMLLILYYAIILFMIYRYKTVSREILCSMLNGAFLLIPFII